MKIWFDKVLKARDDVLSYLSIIRRMITEDAQARITAKDLRKAVVKNLG
jgi:hypothetical protein